MLITQLALVSAALWSGALLDPIDEAHAVAPADCWYTPGGSAGRTRQSRTAPVRGPFHVAWQHEAKGELVEGEPLVWDDVVIVSVHRGGDRRALRALDLVTGAVLCEETFRTDRPLVPSMWEQTVLVRASESELAAFRIAPGGFVPSWEYEVERDLGAPLLLDEEVYVVADGRLLRLDLGSPDVAWEVGGILGDALAIHGEVVFALQEGRGFHRPSGGSRQAYISGFSRDTGDTLERQIVSTSGMPGAIWIAATSRCVLVQAAEPIPGIVPPASTLVFERHLFNEEAAPATTRPFVGSASAQLDGSDECWFGVLSQADGARRFVGVDAAETFEVLAADGVNADFTSAEVPMSIADRVAYVGGRAFDLDTKQVLWRLGRQAAYVVVPARDTALVVESSPTGGGGRCLLALRQGRASSAEASEPRTELEEGRLVLCDGTVVSSGFALDPDGGRIRTHKSRKRTTWRTDDVLLVEQSDGRVWYAPSGESAVRGMKFLARSLQAEAYADLADAARDSNDAELVQQLVDDARAHGADEGALGAVTSWLKKIARRRNPLTVKEAERQDVLDRRREIEALPPQVLGERLAVNADHPSIAMALVDRLLAADPEDERAVAWVRERLPAGVSPPEGPAVGDWLAYLRATATHPVTVHVPPSDAVTDEELTFADRQLHRASRSWRGDVLGFGSERVFIVAPQEEPALIALSVALGELVCRMLEQSFADALAEVGTDDVASEPLVVHLFSSAGHYGRQERLGHREDEPGLAWDSGFYDPTDGVTRLLLPTEEVGFDAVMETYVHELTHHWLDAHLGRGESWRADETRGYWVVEGFASMVEGFDFDVATGSWSPRLRDPYHLGVVAECEEGADMEWNEVFAMDHDTFKRPPRSLELELELPTRLGEPAYITSADVVHARAMAAARYFYLDEQLRSNLLDYVAAHYAGDDDRLDVSRAFGTVPTYLGAQIASFARSQLEDYWNPARP